MWNRSDYLGCCEAVFVAFERKDMAFLRMKRFFTRKQDDQDFSKYFCEVPQTRKKRLLEECKKNDVSIYIDNSSETSSSIYAEFRGVVSEAELERRLNAKKAVHQSSRANFIAALALIVSVVALTKSFL